MVRVVDVFLFGLEQAQLLEQVALVLRCREKIAKVVEINDSNGLVLRLGLDVRGGSLRGPLFIQGLLHDEQWKGQVARDDIIKVGELDFFYRFCDEAGLFHGFLIEVQVDAAAKDYQ